MRHLWLILVSMLIGIGTTIVVTVLVAANVDTHLPEQAAFVQDMARAGDRGWSVIRRHGLGTTGIDCRGWYAGDVTRLQSLEAVVPGWFPIESMDLDAQLRGTGLDAQAPVAVLRSAVPYHVSFEARGWPMRCAWCQAGAWDDRGTLTQGVAGGRALSLQPWQSNFRFAYPRVVPTRPIWSGLIVNSLVYAALAAAAMLMVRLHRRLRHYRRGRCPSCGADRGHVYDTACPRCGQEP